MTIAATIATTETGGSIDRRAQDRGLALHDGGAVEVIGDTLALVEDAGMVNVADATGCGCSPVEDRGGHACSHQWAFYFASTAAEGFDRGTAA